MQRVPALGAIHELAHIGALNFDPRVEQAWIKSERGYYVTGTDDAPMSELTCTRDRFLWVMLAGVTAEHLYQYRTHADPAVSVAARYYAAPKAFCSTPYGEGDGLQVAALIEQQPLETARLVYRLGSMLLPLVRDCDEAVLAQTWARIEALAEGERMEFDTGAELMALAGIGKRRH